MCSQKDLFIQRYLQKADQPTALLASLARDVYVESFVGIDDDVDDERRVHCQVVRDQLDLFLPVVVRLRVERNVAFGRLQMERNVSDIRDQIDVETRTHTQMMIIPCRRRRSYIRCRRVPRMMISS